uniref:Uncharacterized protein n=1 Tax=Oryza barthii TaxID=65489 RepID=A0A0D3G4Y5_9ORYZ
MVILAAAILPTTRLPMFLLDFLIDSGYQGYSSEEQQPPYYYLAIAQFMFIFLLEEQMDFVVVKVEKRDIMALQEFIDHGKWTGGNLLGMVAPLAIGLEEDNKQMHQRELKYEELCGRNELAGEESCSHI